MDKQALYSRIAAEARPGKRPTDLLKACKPKLFAKLTDRYGKLSSEVLYRHFNPNAHAQCMTCSKTTAFINFLQGYQPYCSQRCCGASDQHKANVRKGVRDRYGVDAPAQLKSVRRKMTATLMRNHGVTNASKLDWVQKKKRKTSMRKYGVPSPMQSRRIFERNWASLRGRKNVTINGVEFRVQGYEHHALRYLIEEVGIDARAFKKPKAVRYKDHKDGRKRYYHPDLAIGRLRIEVKSVYTAGIAPVNKEWRGNLKAKLKGVQSSGRDFLLLVMNKKGEVIYHCLNSFYVCEGDATQAIREYM